MCLPGHALHTHPTQNWAGVCRFVIIVKNVVDPFSMWKLSESKFRWMNEWNILSKCVSLCRFVWENI